MFIWAIFDSFGMGIRYRFPRVYIHTRESVLRIGYGTASESVRIGAKRLANWIQFVAVLGMNPANRCSFALLYEPLAIHRQLQLPVSWRRWCH